jgi:glycosyltransferase involved in cell wall biosynthesis
LKVCAIIPAFNEEATIAQVIIETKRYVDVVVVVDDASTDTTAELAKQNGAHVIHRTKSHGPSTALQSLYDSVEVNGLDYMGFDYIVQVDADGQHDPKYIPEMLRVAQSCDIVIASRFLNTSYKQYVWARRIGILFFTFVTNVLMRSNLTDVISGYRVYTTKSLKKLSPISARHWAVEQTLEALKKGLIIKEVSAEMPIRTTGKSQFSKATYLGYPFKMIWVVLKVLLFK